MTPALVILAAGVGSRYGGPKQIEPVGPAGATLLDYSIYDARRAGFGTVVVVIRPELATAFDRIDATVAIQRLDDIPAGLTMPAARTKPWGTGHAVLAAATAVRSPFAVVNADDFYGRDAFARAADQLLRDYEEIPLPIREKGLAASRRVLDTYALDKQRRELVEFFSGLVAER